MRARGAAAGRLSLARLRRGGAGSSFFGASETDDFQVGDEFFFPCWHR